MRRERELLGVFVRLGVLSQADPVGANALTGFLLSESGVPAVTLLRPTGTRQTSKRQRSDQPSNEPSATELHCVSFSARSTRACPILR